MPCVLGLDIGTTSTIGILIRLPDQVLGLASRPVTLCAPHPGWAEEDPKQWWDNACGITRELITASGIAPGEIAAVGVTGMLPAVVLLDGRDELIRPSIQQSDGRCGAEVAELAAEIPEAGFLARAGNGINQQLVTAKLRWLERHEPQAFRRIATVFGSYDYVNWQLTGIKAVEQNWALEAGFTDVATDAIADDLVALAHIPRSVVPSRSLSHAILGKVTPEAAAATGLPAGIPVVGGAADHIASALCAGVLAPGDVLLKFGGSVDVLIASDTVAPDPRLYLDYHLVPGLYMPNGCMATGGSGLNWFVQTFAGGEREAAAKAGLTLHQYLDRLAAAIPAGAEGVQVLPYFLGEKTPIHDPAIRATFSGLSLSSGLPHLWRALLEAYAYAVRHHVEVLRDMGHATTNFLVSDGGSNSSVWMQIVADVLQVPLQRLSGHPGSCLGAAWTAAVGSGLAEDWAGVSGFISLRDRIEPQASNRSVYARGYESFRALYQQLRGTTA
ncbi:carbohydrate kinase [Labrys miyagiensis]|uniref:Carbohydrate kinase n=1 Tax=Labrys miyagiensis TaxID=346912 RepID=A0ABQ6CS13_9HYPH|nr:FGGY-family carbohydrate kinase [Labrys miyagiensis]GLS23146.1 carbohydrate kinase [Labrys miyagiensis]